MTRRATLSNGDTFIIDDEAHTIEPEHPDDDPWRPTMIADIASHLMLTDDLIGPQVDDMVGVRGTWDDPRAPVVALAQSARALRLNLVTVEPV